MRGKSIAQINLTSPNHRRLPTGTANVIRDGKRYAVMVIASGLNLPGGTQPHYTP